MPRITPLHNEAEIARVAAMLPSHPVGVGRPIIDRRAWKQAALQPAFEKELRDAEIFAQQPTPALTDTLYNDVVKTGSRDNYEVPFRLRSTRLVAFTVAECIQNGGVYLPKIEAEINAMLDERSWAAPSHVLFGGQPLGGIERSVDLAAATRAWTIATADYWLGNKLKASTRQRIRAEMRRRVFDYYEDGVRSGHPSWGWMTQHDNWNAVCNSGVVGAALALLDSPSERALFILSSQAYLASYLDSFKDDGYDNEGLGYWAYGFGSYLCLSETVYEATSGQINMFAGDKLRQIALFPRHLEIIDGIYPAFGDSGVVGAVGLEHVVSTALMLLINFRWNMGWSDLNQLPNDMFATHPLGDRLYGLGLFGFPLPVYQIALVPGSPARGAKVSSTVPRFFFKDSSVFIARSQHPGAPTFGFALKGGSNAGGHGHNDNGSYVVVCNGAALIVDPGMEVYTSKTFGPHRYESMMMNSYGHDVPYIGGTMQRNGTDAQGKLISTAFTDAKDTIVMDLTSSYSVPGLQRLQRTYIFDRSKPSLEIIDDADFSQPTAFGSALVTTSKWKRNGPGVFTLYQRKMAVRATVAVENGVVTDTEEPIRGFRMPPGLEPERIGVNAQTASTHVVMHTMIMPASAH